MGLTDRELGMHRRITRRDFLNGMSVAAATAVSIPGSVWGAGADPALSGDYYPPMKIGLRGDHEGLYEVPHSIRDGNFWKSAPAVSDTGEDYDLVIVGGGISGLASAYFYRQALGANARILILENHDDFGGHAKRNEFHQTGRMMLGYGGTFSIESPAPYSAVAKSVIQDLGIDVESYKNVSDARLYSSFGLRPGVFFNKDVFGRDALVLTPHSSYEETPEPKRTADERWRLFSQAAPMADQAKLDLRRLYESKEDYLPGLTSDEKKAKLARISYSDFLLELVKTHPDVVKYLQDRPYSLFGVGIDAVSAQDAWGLGFPGFDGMKLDPSYGPGMNRDARRNEEADKYFFHFPDGNSSIARLLVRKLIPGAVPGSNATDIVTSRVNYAALDRDDQATRIRLNSTVVKVEQLGNSGAAQKRVDITFMQGGTLKRVRGRKCVLACWHVMIPYICPELPEQQKQALSFAVKVPLVYTNVLIRNWTSFQKLGINSVYAPGSFHSEMNLDLPVSIGDYHCSKNPSEPIVVHLQRVPTKPGLPARQQHRAGRMDLYNTAFETFERNIRDQMARTLGAGGFDPARDIAAITVNRWPHGYAYEYNSLWDPFWLNGGEQPCVVARQPFGNIAIANSDAGAYAYTDGAIDQAHRAVQDLLKTS
jgi:spermidine dehydrogenase